MKLFLLSLLCSISLQSFSQTDQEQLESALSKLSGVSFRKIIDSTQASLQYELLVQQPIDHQHPEKGIFNQQVILTHRGFDHPSVMETQGYELFPGPNEPEQIASANNLNIEYRFYGKSVTAPMQWTCLTVEQEAADLHHINELFRKIYKGKWISTGVSKGGSTTIYYKYFYPADVDLAIPYVAPLDNSLEDKRIYAFFDTIGTAACRSKIKAFQTYLLKHEKEALVKLAAYSKANGLTYNYTGSIGRSFEYAVLEYSFSFWQYNDVCASIPDNDDLNDHLSALMRTSDISSFTDDGIAMFSNHYYQAATQCGYYGYNIEPFKNDLHYFTENPSSILPPKGVVLKPYDPALNEKVQRWLAEKGNNIIYIYGGSDTWTAAGIIPSPAVNAKRFVIPNANHATARIKNMSSAMQAEFTQLVISMSGISVAPAAIN